MTFERILENTEWRWDYDGVYTYPRIPAKKLMSAISAYAPDLEPREVLILLDDTVFGGAREGMIVSRDALYAKQKFEEPCSIRWSEIRQLQPQTNSRIEVNGQIFFEAHIIHHFAMLALAGRLSHFIEDDHNSRKDALSPKIGHSLVSVHEKALAAFAQHLDQEYDVSSLEFPRLVDGHFKCVMRKIGPLTLQVQQRSPSHFTAQQRDIELAGGVLLTFIIFHCAAFARTPDTIKSNLGDIYYFFAGAHMHYRESFLKNMVESIGPLKNEMRELLEIAAMIFMVSDGDTDFQLNLPREDALEKLLSMLGFSAASRIQLQHEFDNQLQRWWLEMENILVDEDPDQEAPSGSEGDPILPRRDLAAHADVLGIRPGASRNEIDLAYRGRRSQYHPDRYSGEGDDAIRWATERMKEINVAYQSLIDEAEFRGR